MTKERGISVFGSTGTIGRNTLEVAEQQGLKVVCLAAGKNIDLLREQIDHFSPRVVCVSDSEDASRLSSTYPGLEIVWGEPGLVQCAALDVNMVVMGIVGFAALRPTLEAIRLGKSVALANKEALIVGGSLLKQEIERSGARVIPVDSEHNAVFQLLEGRSPNEIDTIVLTASGGPFYRRPEIRLDDVTPEAAIKHPNWKMGPKISVDSATMMNKGLEVVEAHFLFDLPETRIEVWVHPQSLVHGAVWLKDGSCLAQLSVPDMRSSIGHALAYPERFEGVVPKLTMTQLSQIEFFPPDPKRFPALELARSALRQGPSHLVVLNASNEIAVAAFLAGRIRFTQIADVVAKSLESHAGTPIDSVEQLFEIDRLARQSAESLLRGTASGQHPVS